MTDKTPKKPTVKIDGGKLNIVPNKMPDEFSSHLEPTIHSLHTCWVDGYAVLTVKDDHIELTFLKDSDSPPTPPQKLVWFKSGMLMEYICGDIAITIVYFEISGSVFKMRSLSWDSLEELGLKSHIPGGNLCFPSPTFDSIKIYGGVFTSERGVGANPTSRGDAKLSTYF